MNKIAMFLLVLIGTGITSGLSQPFYPVNVVPFNDVVIPRIDIFIDPVDLNTIYTDIWSDTEYPATFVYNDGVDVDSVFDVGFRLRGNTSRTAAKKSFKVAFNSFTPGKQYKGLDKLNLNGEHNDPSIVRSKLCWDLLRDMKIPAPRANHVDLYINGDFYGLYINVEHIDEEFIDTRFGNQDGNLFKCIWPADLNFISNNPDDYKINAYELKTNTTANDYSDLANLIDILNNAPLSTFACELKEVFNVEDYLKVIAFDILTGNWDGPLYNKNNFYLYHNTETDRFEYIPYDLDNTFGIDWFSIDWDVRDMYTWSHPTESRPLFERILAVQEFKDQFSFYMERWINEAYQPATYLPKIDAFRTLLTNSVLNDPYHSLDYGYSHTDFLNSFDQALSGHVKTGIKSFVTTRESASASQMVLNNIAPIVKYVRSNQPQINEPIIVNAFVEDDDANLEVWTYYQVNGGPVDSVQMFDDGFNEDDLPNDGVFGAMLAPVIQPGLIHYYLNASDVNNQSNRVPCSGTNVILVDTSTSSLFINEFMAVNTSTIADEFGEYEDWIEIYNGETAPVWTGDIYLTDNLNNPGKWNLPDSTIAVGGFMLIWADQDTLQGNLHANFKLDQFGESIGLFQYFDGNYIPLDIISFGPQSPNVAYGYFPDGTGNHQLMGSPTPGYSNVSVGIEEFQNIKFANTLQIVPNPFHSDLKFTFQVDKVQHLDIQLFDANGNRVTTMLSETFNPGEHTVNWGPTQIKMEPGLYLIVMHSTETFSGQSNLYTKKVLFVR